MVVSDNDWKKCFVVWVNQMRGSFAIMFLSQLSTSRLQQTIHWPVSSTLTVKGQLCESRSALFGRGWNFFSPNLIATGRTAKREKNAIWNKNVESQQSEALIKSSLRPWEQVTFMVYGQGEILVSECAHTK